MSDKAKVETRIPGFVAQNTEERLATGKLEMMEEESVLGAAELEALLDQEVTGIVLTVEEMEGKVKTTKEILEKDLTTAEVDPEKIKEVLAGVDAIFEIYKAEVEQTSDRKNEITRDTLLKLADLTGTEHRIKKTLLGREGAEAGEAGRFETLQGEALVKEIDEFLAETGLEATKVQSAKTMKKFIQEHPAQSGWSVIETQTIPKFIDAYALYIEEPAYGDATDPMRKAYEEYVYKRFSDNLQIQDAAIGVGDTMTSDDIKYWFGQDVPPGYQPRSTNKPEERELSELPQEIHEGIVYAQPILKFSEWHAQQFEQEEGQSVEKFTETEIVTFYKENLLPSIQADSGPSAMERETRLTSAGIDLGEIGAAEQNLEPLRIYFEMYVDDKGKLKTDAPPIYLWNRAEVRETQEKTTEGLAALSKAFREAGQKSLADRKADFEKLGADDLSSRRSAFHAELDKELTVEEATKLVDKILGTSLEEGLLPELTRRLEEREIRERELKGQEERLRAELGGGAAPGGAEDTSEEGATEDGEPGEEEPAGERTPQESPKDREAKEGLSDSISDYRDVYQIQGKIAEMIFKSGDRNLSDNDDLIYAAMGVLNSPEGQKYWQLNGPGTELPGRESESFYDRLHSAIQGGTLRIKWSVDGTTLLDAAESRKASGANDRERFEGEREAYRKKHVDEPEPAEPPSGGDSDRGGALPEQPAPGESGGGSGGGGRPRGAPGRTPREGSERVQEQPEPLPLLHKPTVMARRRYFLKELKKEGHFGPQELKLFLGAKTFDANQFLLAHEGQPKKPRSAKRKGIKEEYGDFAGLMPGGPEAKGYIAAARFLSDELGRLNGKGFTFKAGIDQENVNHVIDAFVQAQLYAEVMKKPGVYTSPKIWASTSVDDYDSIDTLSENSDPDLQITYRRA